MVKLGPLTLQTGLVLLVAACRLASRLRDPRRSNCRPNSVNSKSMSALELREGGITH